MIKPAAVGGVAVLGILALAGCSGEVTAADAYQVGCPAVDAVAGGSDVAGNAAKAGLHRLYDSRVLGDEAQAWLGDALTVIDSGDSSGLSSEAKTRIVDGCAENGYTLTNLK